MKGPDRSELQRLGPWFANGVLGPGSGIGLRKSDPELKAKIDEALKAALADGTIKSLYLKYLSFLHATDLTARRVKLVFLT